MSLDPVILFFLLGVLARVARSDLRLPEALYEALSIYLLLAIGLKGGAQLAVQPLATLWPVALAAIALSAVVPLLLFPVLRAGLRLGPADAGSIAAHYGSVSVVTFAVSQSALSRAGLEPESWLAMLVALMEAPGIVVGVMLSTAWLVGQSAGIWAEPKLAALAAVSLLLVWRTQVHLLWLLGAGAFAGAMRWV